MDKFLQSVELQAYHIALVAVGTREDALDVVQDTMLGFVNKYLKKSESEWRPLFFKVLYNQIKSVQRKRRLQRKWFTWLSSGNSGENEIEKIVDDKRAGPEHRSVVNSTYLALEKALKKLSLRQQQAFFLRGWQELSVAETALAMGCSEGSVKTHYFRALEQLRKELGDHWP